MHVCCDQNYRDGDFKPADEVEYLHSRNFAANSPGKAYKDWVFCLQHADRRQKDVECQHEKLPRISISDFFMTYAPSRSFVSCFSRLDVRRAVKVSGQYCNCPIDLIIHNQQLNRHCERIQKICVFVK